MQKAMQQLCHQTTEALSKGTNNFINTDHEEATQLPVNHYEVAQSQVCPAGNMVWAT